MKLNILLICNKPKVGNNANTIVDHIEAFEDYSSNKIWICSNFGELSDKLDLNRFDAIIIHYSLCLINGYYLGSQSKARLRDFKGLKIAFVQDEYRQIDKTISELAFLKLDVLFSCFPESEIERIYTKEKLPNVRVENNLTGYIPERLSQQANQRPIKDRPIHVGYRGRKLAFWYGELSFEKWNIVDKWYEHVKEKQIKVDLSYNEKDRIYGEAWIDFLSSCKTTLGVESGASVMDFTGELEKTIDLHQLKHPNDSFHTVQKKYLLEHEGKYKLNQISPRCFEAIALKTVLVLYEGEYSGILIPNRHYIPLKKDFSNINEVLLRIQDDAYLQKMADTAFQEIAQNEAYSYQNFVAKVDKIMEDEFNARNKSMVETPYNERQYQSDMRSIPLKNKIYKVGLRMYQKLPLKLRLFVKRVVRPQAMIR